MNIKPVEKNSPYDVFDVGHYAAVKYQSGMNLKMLLGLFWLDEWKTEALRGIFKENSIMPVNGDLRTSSGGVIPTNTVIKVHKRHISEVIMKKAIRASDNFLNSPTKTADELPEKTTRSLMDKVDDAMERIMANKRTKYFAIGGATMIIGAVWLAYALVIWGARKPIPEHKEVDSTEIAQKEIREEQVLETEDQNGEEISPKIVKIPIAWEIGLSDTVEITKAASIKTDVSNLEKINTPISPELNASAPQEVLVNGNTIVFTSKSKAEDLRKILADFNAATSRPQKKEVSEKK